MKSKTKLFLLPILAIAIAATAFFGYANFNTPAEADAATTVRVYYKDNSGWGAGNVLAHAWGAELDQFTATTSVGANWYYFDYDTTTMTGMQFCNSAKNEFTYDITPNSGYSYNFAEATTKEGNKWSYNWYFSDEAHDPDQYYVLGSFNSWSASASCKMTKLNFEGTNDKAILYGCNLQAGDEFKIRYAPTPTTWGDWYGSIDNNDNNATIAETGLCAIILNSGFRATSVSQEGTMAVSTVKAAHDTTNGKLLLTAGFEFGALVGTNGQYRLGYNDGTSDHDTATYYSGLIRKTGVDTYAARETANDLFSLSAENGKLMIFECTYAAGTYQLYIKYNGVKVATAEKTV